MAFYVDTSGQRVELVEKYLSYDQLTEFYLCKTLDNRFFVIDKERFEKEFSLLQSVLSTQEKLALYRSVFAGRQDVYAKSYLNKEGKIQYYPSYNYGWKQLSPEKRTFQPLTDEVLKSHLRGEQAIGMFPLLTDDSCRFLVLDFDKADWKESVQVIRRICNERGIQVNVEISRSGNGAHLWFFFADNVSAREARLFGKKILELSMLESSLVSFDSFDRMFPNQDTLPKGGFGNLIALPLQGESYTKGRTVFVDDSFLPYPNQWDYLSQVEKIPLEMLQDMVKEEVSDLELNKDLHLVWSNTLQLNKADLTAKTIYYLKKLASFSNPEFYLKQAMRQPTYQVSERLYLFEERDDSLCLPRGLMAKLHEIFEIVVIDDQRISYSPISVTFSGELTFEQELALSDLLTSDNGLLHAETGFGKTVLGAALIAKRQARTIILVHNKQLLDQWLERLGQFLVFEEEVAIRYTPTGREKIIGHVGQFAGTKKWRSKLVDVVMIQSLFQLENLTALFSDYGMMIVDECHHVSALMFEKVVAQFPGKFLYGLTATPERKNGHEPIVFQSIGPILHTAEKRETNFKRQLYLQFTSFGHLEPQKVKSSDFIALSDWLATDLARNQQIVKDVLTQWQERRNILILVNRIQQLDLLEELLQGQGIDKLYVISGKSKPKERQATLEKLQQIDDGFVLLSTGKYIGEGFDLPQLDTLVLAAPFSWRNNLIQYAGRIHRHHPEKSQVRIFDYVDIHVPYLEKMYQKRQIAYRKMDYVATEENDKQSVFYDSGYEAILSEDLKKAREEIVLVLPYVKQHLLQELLKTFPKISMKLAVPHKVKNREWLSALSSESLTVEFVDAKIVTPVIIIDHYLVWYGFAPLFLPNTDWSLLRLESEGLAKELSAWNSLDEEYIEK